jgi:hypothetical protein
MANNGIYIEVTRRKQNSTYIDRKAILFFAQDAEKSVVKTLELRIYPPRWLIQINIRGKSKVSHQTL